MQHGGLSHILGIHTVGIGQQRGKRPCTFPTIAPPITTSNTTNFQNNFKRASIITKLDLKS